jgi:hypothetical protein
MRLSFLLVVGLLGWLTAFPAHAEDRVNPIEDSSDSGSDYTLLTNETPGMVIVITYQQIRARGYRSVFEILRDLPGFASKGGFGQSTMNLSLDGEQSQNNEKFLLFIDGVLEQDLWRRSIWLSYQYSVHFIKNIRIFYGPAAVRFGANAMSGVIFIDTKKAEDLADGYGDFSLTKDIRNQMWAVDFMLGHSYSKRANPKLAKSLFSWYLRGRFYFSDERNADYDKLWNTDLWGNPPSNSPVSHMFLQSKTYLDQLVARYRTDYQTAYPGTSAQDLTKAVNLYRTELLSQFQNDSANSGLYGNPLYTNRNLAFSAEAGFRFDNWFLRAFLWSMGTGPGLRYMPYSYQTNSQWWVRNFSLSLHHLRSELWSSGSGEKAQVIYFNLGLTFQRHEVPGNSLSVNFAPRTLEFHGTTCKDPTGQNTIPCTWKEYTWQPLYRYVVSSSFRAEPKLDFRLLESRVKFSIGLNTGVSFLQGESVTSNRPEPQKFGDSQRRIGAGNQYEHIYLSGFLQGEVTFAPWLLASFGLRSDWEMVRGEVEVVPNCNRALIPCYRFSAPVLGRASLISKMLNNKLQVRLSYGYAFLSPSNWELFGDEGDRVGNALDARDLLPQDKHSIELNVYANVSNRLYFTFSLFHNWLNNVNALVMLPYRQNEIRNINIGNQRTIGARFYGIVKIIKQLRLTTSATILYPLLDAFNLEQQTATAIWMRNVPFFTGNVSLDFRSHDYEQSHFFGSLRVNLVSGRQNIGFDQLENGKLQIVEGAETQFYGIFHLSAGYMWRPPEGQTFPKSVSISATAENILNTTYYDLGIRTGREPLYNPLVPNAGINAFFNLAVGF